MLNFAAIDFETANHHRSSVCSVGIAIVRNGEIVETIYHLVRPEPNYYSYWATDCHGLRKTDTNNAMPFPEIWQAIAPRIEGLPFVAHNKSFDESCLKGCFQHYGMEYPNYSFFCTLQAARKTFRHLANHQLHTVSQAVGFDLTHHHHALADAEACARIAIQIL